MTYAMSFSDSSSSLDPRDFSDGVDASAGDANDLAQASSNLSSSSYLCFDWTTKENVVLNQCDFEGNRDFDVKEYQDRGTDYLYEIARANDYDGFVEHVKRTRNEVWF